MTAPIKRRKKKLALSATAGEVESAGHPRTAKALAHALTKATSAPRDAADELTHGFHTYPARMHPLIARTLLAELQVPNDTLVDPFCGSGTTLVEATVAGRAAHGVDLNPIAIKLARAKTNPYTATEAKRLLRLFDEVAERSFERVKARTDARAPLKRFHAQWYDGHVLKELAGLLEEIRAVQSAPDRGALEAAFSAILIKVSRRESDTRARQVKKRIRKGLSTELFVGKGKELCKRWADLRRACSKHAVDPPRVIEGDARNLGDLLPRGLSPGLVLTSPPYGGTYDYAEQHALRCAWLGIHAHAFERGELGARRRGGQADAHARWDQELGDALGAAARVCHPDGLLVLVLGDGLLSGKRIAAEEQVARLAPNAGLRPLARASVGREDRQGGKPRREHVLALQRI